MEAMKKAKAKGKKKGKGRKELRKGDEIHRHPTKGKNTKSKYWHVGPI